MPNNEVGLAPYAPGRNGPQAALEQIKRRCALRAELQLLSEEIETSLAGLSPIELDELKRLVRVEAEAPVEIERIEQERAIARTTKAMDIKLSRNASAALQAEALRRLQSGYSPNSSALAGEAIMRQFT